MSKDAVLNVVGSSPGQPYSAAAVASDRNNILAMYYNDGFPEARFDDKAVPGSAPYRMQLDVPNHRRHAHRTCRRCCSPAINTRGRELSRGKW